MYNPHWNWRSFDFYLVHIHVQVWLEDNDYIKLDYGGDGGTPEVAMMALDYYLYTGDEVFAALFT